MRYVDFPDELKGHDQTFTVANLSKLRSLGNHEPPTELERGIDLTIM